MRHFILSSTAAVYGEPEYTPIDEEHPTKPVNVYGGTKLMLEEILSWYDRAYGLKYASLRYFNAAGADPEGDIGEDHSPETHLIPIVMQAASGKREKVVIYGTDYPYPGRYLSAGLHTRNRPGRSARPGPGSPGGGRLFCYV